MIVIGECLRAVLIEFNKKLQYNTWCITGHKIIHENEKVSWSWVAILSTILQGLLNKSGGDCSET